MSYSKDNVTTLTQLRNFSAVSQQSMSAKLAETTSFEDFGAVGDGNADDTAAISAALSSGKKRIIGKAGSTYVISSQITIPTGVVIDFNYSTIKRKSGTAFIFDLIKATSVSNVSIKNLTIDGNKTIDSLSSANVSQRFAGLVIKTSSNIVLDNVTVTGTVNIEDSRGGIYLESSSFVVINKPVVSANDGTGLYINGGSNVTVVDAFAYSNVMRGIRTANLINSTFQRITAYSNTQQQTFICGTSNQVIDSRFSLGNGYPLLQIGEAVSGNYAHDAIISNIHLSTCTAGELLKVVSSNRVSVSKVNAYSSSATTANLVFDNCAQPMLSEIVSNASSGSGVLFTNTCSLVKIASGDFFSNAKSGIESTACAGMQIGKVVNCFNNVVAGINLTSVTAATISARCFDNQGTKTQVYGIKLTTCSDVQLDGANFAGNLTNWVSAISSLFGITNVKTGTDALNGTFTATASNTTSIILNNNARGDYNNNITVIPYNAAARTLGIPYVSAITDKTSFALTWGSSATGGEIYQYIIS